MKKYSVVILLFISGCIMPRPDGLYINGRMVIANATVDQFCQAQGALVELVRHNKTKWSR